MNRFFRAICVKARIIHALFIRSINIEHGSSNIGYLSVLVRPLFQIAVISTMFSIIGRSTIGDSVILFMTTGLVTYNLCIGLANKMLQINKVNQNVLERTHVTLFDISISTLLSQTLIMFLITTIILTGLGYFGYWNHQVDSLLGILLTAVTSILLGYGIGLFNSSVVIIIPSYEKIWQILSMPLLLMSGVFFVADHRFPIEVLNILKYNPLLHIIESMRDSFYRSWESTLFDLSYVLWFVLSTIFMGLVMQKLAQPRQKQ